MSYVYLGVDGWNMKIWRSHFSPSFQSEALSLWERLWENSFCISDLAQERVCVYRSVRKRFSLDLDSIDSWLVQSLTERNTKAEPRKNDAGVAEVGSEKYAFIWDKMRKKTDC